MLTFRNGEKSWFARAAAESCFDFFNPTSMGMDRLGSATLIGSNALIQRRALESIGGYRAGLAEDLATSIALHAAGWKSTYVAEPLAPGLAPTDVAAWFTQQLKWARGVFEILLVDYPRYFGRLSWGQRVSYAVRMTYYWAGLVGAIHMIFTAGILIGGERVAVVDLQQYLLHLLPLSLVAFGIRIIALRCWRHPSVPNALQWRAILLIQSTWPVYTLAWFMAILRVPLRFRSTPKRAFHERRWNWLAPQIGASLILLGAVIVGMSYPDTAHPGFLMAFAGLQTMPQLFLVWQAQRGSKNAASVSARLGASSVHRPG
jgi:cellulose synthase (UDP-forming)